MVTESDFSTQVNVTLMSVFVTYSAARKIRMGKKVEKALGKDKGQASASSHEHDDDPNKPPGSMHSTLKSSYTICFASKNYALAIIFRRLKRCFGTSRFSNALLHVKLSVEFVLFQSRIYARAAFRMTSQSCVNELRW